MSQTDIQIIGISAGFKAAFLNTGSIPPVRNQGDMKKPPATANGERVCKIVIVIILVADRVFLFMLFRFYHRKPVRHMVVFGRGILKDILVYDQICPVIRQYFPIK